MRPSGANAVKQDRRHSNVEPGDYARVQRIVDGGAVQGRRPRAVIAFLDMDGRLWRAVLKVTKDRSETYLVSLHKARREDLCAARSRFGKIPRDTDQAAPGGPQPPRSPEGMR